MKTKHKCNVAKVALSVLFLMIIALAPGQDYNLQGVALRDLDGELIDPSSLMDDSLPVMIVFWNSREKNCTKQLEALLNAKADNFTDDQLRFIGVFVSEGSCASNAKAIVNGSGWDGEFLVDYNGDLKRAMGIPSEPYTILFNQKHEVVCRYEGYCSGAEDLMCEKVRHCLAEATKGK
jgi:hypothetical protein